MCVQRGVLLSGDNVLFEEVTAYIGQERNGPSSAAELGGSRPSTLHDEVKAGLLLYSLTAAMLVEVLLPEDQPLIFTTMALVDHALAEGNHHEQGYPSHSD
jgi:hypothetical protein